MSVLRRVSQTSPAVAVGLTQAIGSGLTVAPSVENTGLTPRGVKTAFARSSCAGGAAQVNVSSKLPVAGEPGVTTEDPPTRM